MKYSIIAIWYNNHHTAFSALLLNEFIVKLQEIRDSHRGTLEEVYIIESIGDWSNSYRFNQQTLHHAIDVYQSLVN